ncbi:MAG: VWA domain-containing protein [Deltaproteobacteria bacterium]|nr:VWA domain-containing protein [Deltaproteobacteria bacterium]
MPALLDALAPTRLMIELPADLGAWLPWLGHAALAAPVALAAVTGGGVGAADVGGVGFWPMADFSPELAAARWAVERGVALEAIDLPYGARLAAEPARPAFVAGSGDVHALAHVDVEALWDTAVEAASPGQSPEAVRRAGLYFGWALRADAGAVPARDLAREAFMRARIAEALARGERVVAVIGAFHAPALVPGDHPPGPPIVAVEPVTTSLIPYSWELLDSRSGYPAGIRDPAFQDRMLCISHADSGAWASYTDVVSACAVEVVRALRRRGHPAGVSEAREVTRVAVDLATLRGLPAPGRRELVEALETTLAHGELLGRGRAVAAAMQEVLVGARLGRLPPDAPRSGLAPHVEGLVAALGLPGPGQPEKDLRLDPLRSDLDRARVRALERLVVLRVPYGERVDGVASAVAGVPALGSRWRLAWTPGTGAMLAVAGRFGATLAQAAEGALRARAAAADAGPAAGVALAHEAASAGLARLAEERLAALGGEAFLGSATLADLHAAAILASRVARGQVAALLPEPGEAPFVLPDRAAPARFVAACVGAVEGLQGATADDDARLLLDVVRLVEAEDRLGDGRLAATLERFATAGAPLVQGAAVTLLVMLGRLDAARAGERLAGFMSSGAAGADAALRLRGALLVAGPMIEADPALLEPLVARVDTMSEGDFVLALPSLREGFDVLAPAARQRLLDVIGEPAQGLELEVSPAEAGAWAALDLAGAEAARRWPRPELSPTISAPPTDPATMPERSPRARDRWRLVLGRERSRLPPELQRQARALDMLYGHGRGEGARAGAGSDPSFPTVREWADELEGLFGLAVSHEVLGLAAERGIPAAAAALDPEAVVPSVALLERMLALRGALPEAHLGRVRRIVERCVEAITRTLATTLRPALVGVATARPTRRRPGGRPRLDLARTLRVNLARARLIAGRVHVVPEVPIFRARSRRALTWRVVLVVDVSGSMEASVIYAAMMAAILAGVPWVEARFLAFSTEVVDLSAHVADPLALLLEVKVGGGTDIGQALRHARALVTVPERTVVLVVSDFEEGGSLPVLLGEVRALVESGAHALGLAALDDQGAPRYATGIASQVVAAGMPIAALTPLELARWLGDKLR